MQKTPHDPTNQEILEAVNSYASRIEHRLESVEKCMDSMDKRMDSVDKRMDSMDKRMDSMDKRMATKEDVGKLRSDMIDFIDKKFFDLKGDLIVIIKKQDKKINELITILPSKNVLSDKEAKALLRLGPFPTVV